MNENPQQHEQVTRPVTKLSKKKQILVLVAFSLIAVGAISLTVWSVVTSTKDTKPGQQYGVGADGFRAYVEQNGNLGVDKMVTKKQVATALGSLAKSVDNGVKEKVFNLNGNQGQTITFAFIRPDGATSSLYIDKRVYKSAQALNDDHIYDATLAAGSVHKHPLYYRQAQTIGTDREYHLMVVDGTVVYRFVIAQPYANIYISEVSALAALKNLAEDASF